MRIVAEPMMRRMD